jgi:cholesterol transport system auxiliary component
MMPRAQPLSIILLSLFGMVACAGILDSKQPAERTYWLEPLIVQGATTDGAARPSIVVTVKAAPGLDTDRLLILESGARLNHYAGARWPDNTPEVLESLLRRTLESTGEYVRVSGSQDSRSSQWQLDLEVREFYTVTSSSGGEIRMTLSGYVTCPDTDHGISLQSTVDVSEERLGLIVAAYQRALHEVTSDLIQQLPERCATDK